MSRYYPLADSEVASVTTILGLLDKSGPLMYWATNCMEKYLVDRLDLFDKLDRDGRIKLLEQAKRDFKSVSKDALDIGSRTHEAIELWIKGQPHNVPADIDKPYHAAIQFFVDNNIEVISSEQTVYNKAEWYAGTQDLKVKVIPTWDCPRKGIESIYIIDLKTSKDFYEPEMPWQIAAYAKCDGNEDVTGGAVLRLDKESGIPYIKDYSEWLEEGYRAFLALRTVFYIGYAKKSLRQEFIKNYDTR